MDVFFVGKFETVFPKNGPHLETLKAICPSESDRNFPILLRFLKKVDAPDKTSVYPLLLTTWLKFLIGGEMEKFCKIEKHMSNPYTPLKNFQSLVMVLHN